MRAGIVRPVASVRGHRGEETGDRRARPVGTGCRAACPRLWRKDGDRTGSSGRSGDDWPWNSVRTKSGIPENFAGPPVAPTRMHSTAALDTTGLPVSIEALMGSTRESVAIFGVLREHVRFGPEQWWGGFALLGYGTHTRAAAEEAYGLILAGKLNLAPLISATTSVYAVCRRCRTTPEQRSHQDPV